MSKAHLSFTILISLIVVVVIAYRMLRNKIAFRPFIAGTLIYVVGQRLVFPVINSFLTEYLGDILPYWILLVLRGLFDSLVVCGGYLLVDRLIFKEERNSITAFSTGFAEGAFQTIFNYGYLILAYSLMFTYIDNGSAQEILLAQGYKLDQIPELIAHYESLSSLAIINIGLQGLLMIPLHTFVSCLIYQYKQTNVKKNLLYAFLILLGFNTLLVLLAMTTEVIFMIVLILLAFAFYYVVVAIRNNPISKVYSEKDFVEHKKKNKK